MGDPRLTACVAAPWPGSARRALGSRLVRDMFETTIGAKGVLLAAPQIGVDTWRRLVIFGSRQPASNYRARVGPRL